MCQQTTFLGSLINDNFILNILGIISICVFLLFTAGKSKVGIWSEIVSISYITVASPLFARAFSHVQSMTMYKFGGSNLIASYSSMTAVCSIPSAIASFSASVCLVICGMSIAYKLNCKRTV